MTARKESLLGAHFSAAGGVANALIEGKSIGATTAQLFTANQRQWQSKPYTPVILEEWKRAVKETGLKQVMSHGSYLVNLGTYDLANLEKSRNAFHLEIERCLQLELDFLNIHPGAALKESVEACLDRIIESILLEEKLLNQGHLRLLLETTAGQGTSVGHTFEQLGYLISALKNRVPIGICIDTCHIFVAGYDVRTPEAWNNTLKEFDQHIGLEFLYAMHLNDSGRGLGEKVDRHAHLGEGKIGWECFRFLMNDSRTKLIPKYLETPNGLTYWEKEIEKLKEFAQIRT